MASYEVGIDAKAVLVSSGTGSVQVQGMSRSFKIPAGKAMRFELAANAAPGQFGAGVRNISSGAAVVVRAAITAGGALGVGLPIALSASEDDAEEVCQRVKSQISPSSAGSSVNCSL